MVGNSFNFQTHRRKLFYYQLYDPVEVMIAKLLLNYVKIMLAGFILILLLILFSGESLVDPNLFVKNFLITIAGLTAVLTMVSGISAYSQNQNSLVAVLSLPLLIPILLLGMRVSLISERFFSDPAVNKYISMLIGIDILLVALCLIFIPLIWKS
jgi:heme exporter protein B